MPAASPFSIINAGSSSPFAFSTAASTASFLQVITAPASS